ncbi:MAG TPA: hypothetical protein VF559_10785 [Caulobacteraceae bacterium]|jgi:hypothetical protein
MTTDIMPAPAGRTPWHLWVVGLLALLWNAYGAYDYLMSNLQGDAYLRSAGMTEPQIAYFNAMPAWMTAVWAIGVWGGVLGSVLLLMRSKWAFHVFAASLAALIVSLIYNFVLSNGREVMGSGALMYVVITAGAVFFLWYAWVARQRGLLR